MSSSDAASYAKFEDGWEEDGVGKDGMPTFKPRLFIVFSKPPYLQTRREAEEDDIEQYSEPYKLYLKQKAGRDIDQVEGYPLALWAAISKAEFDQLVSHGILTVEQLAKLADRKGGAKMPEPIVLLAARAKRMIALQKEQGRYEATIEQLRQERDALASELTELRTQLASANAVINTLQSRIASIPLPQGRAA
jgi:ribosomal protein L29